MLTWGAFSIVGGSTQSRKKLECEQRELITKVQAKIDKLGIETTGGRWRAKEFLYCLEARCPQTGWMVPLIPSLLISKPRTGDKIYVIAELRLDPKKLRYKWYRISYEDFHASRRLSGFGWISRQQTAQVGKTRFQAAERRHLPGTPLCSAMDASQE